MAIHCGERLSVVVLHALLPLLKSPLTSSPEALHLPRTYFLVLEASPCITSCSFRFFFLFSLSLSLSFCLVFARAVCPQTRKGTTSVKAKNREREREMGILVTIFNGVRLFVSTLWDLQEMRFSNIFDDVSSVAASIIMTAVSCVLAARRL
ncbi:hypothetical protein EUGRSUZ_I01058 [Eucalyptus grandis]|uniref:Uncharacterized protein n=2 Tax=Eucalyptus grandis TaxID=71139 RepID=A0ACC3JED6_EUCGR|nr:hypothetical protein EUGRSUZ_I01058 [Eucalyptus grandis]